MALPRALLPCSSSSKSYSCCQWTHRTLTLLHSLPACCSKCKVRAGDQDKDLPAVKVSKRGCAAWDQPVELALGADLTQSKDAAGGPALLVAGDGPGGEALCRFSCTLLLIGCYASTYHHHD